MKYKYIRVRCEDGSIKKQKIEAEPQVKLSRLLGIPIFTYKQKDGMYSISEELTGYRLMKHRDEKVGMDIFLNDFKKNPKKYLSKLKEVFEDYPKLESLKEVRL